MVRNCSDKLDLAKLDSNGNPMPWSVKSGKDANGNQNFTSISRKANKSTSWPSNYSPKKQDEFTTAAFQNMVFSQTKIIGKPPTPIYIFKGIAPDGVTIEFQFDNFNVNLPSTKRISSYPTIN